MVRYAHLLTHTHTYTVLYTTSTIQANTFSPEHDANSKQLLWVDLPALARAVGAVTPAGKLPVLLEVAVPNDGVFCEDCSLPTPKRISDIEQLYVTPETHLMYAATWYSLAAFASGLTYMRFRKPSVAHKGFAAMRKRQSAVQNSSSSSSSSSSTGSTSS
jgi:cytochrome oxidase assembly protein ShyY1